MPFLFSLVLCLTLLSFPLPGQAEDLPSLVIQNHRFSPDTLNVPAKQRVTILIKNLDATAEEVESSDLGIEKIVPAQSQVKLRISPLEVGKYRFVGEYHEETAQGSIIAQ